MMHQRTFRTCFPITFTCIHVVIYLICLHISDTNSLDANNCKQEWVQITTGSYAYRVDCSNLGFKEVPKDLPALTSILLLNGNSISSVDDQAFAGLNSLHTLDLSGNNIETIEESVFESNDALTELDLSRNKLLCDWRIWWLVSFTKGKLKSFKGQCFTPLPLRGRTIANLTQQDLSVNCLSVKKLTGGKADGEYIILVFGKDNSENQMSVYCHKMGSEKPREYLTLPSGIHKNYAVVRKQHECNFGSDMALASLPISNITSYFARVRIDLPSLKIITSDVTFASNTYLKYGQPSLCGKETCIGGTSRIDLRGTYFRLKKSKQIIQEDTCELACGPCPHSDDIELDLINTKKQPFPACTLPLGMQSNVIPDYRIKASSDAGKHFLPYHARLNSLSYSGWCASKLDGSQYLLIDLGTVMTVSGISTQGYKDNKDWVSAYKLMYSTDDISYRKYRELGKKMSLIGNGDSNTVVTHWFKPRIVARHIRIHPQSWNDDGILEHKICMRMELYGCSSDITSYIIKPTSEETCFTIDQSTAKEEYALIKRPQCVGSDFMFTYHHNKLQHTKTGLCLNVNNSNGALLLNENCNKPTIVFQKVRHSSGEAFLIKDLNGYCARLYENEDTKHLFTIWRYCHMGGFAILEMSREGVSAFPPQFTEEKSFLKTDLFKEVSIPCKANADPYAIYDWRKLSVENDGSIDNKVIQKNGHSVLSFKNITWDDRGIYSCNAWNSEGSAVKNYELIVNPLQWFQVTPTDQKVIYGTIASFPCISKGIPDPVVTWFKSNSDDILNPEKFVVTSNGHLEIYNVDYSDEGEYVCFSTSPGLTRSASASLTVYVTQNFTTKPQPAYVLYGNNIVFDCVSEGQPKPRAEWQVKLKKFGSTVVIDSTYANKYEILSNGSLFMKDVNLDDAGEIMCVSYSPGLVRTAAASLTVYVTQEYSLVPKNNQVLYGDDHFLRCSVQGVPKPKISWKFRSHTQKSAHPIMKFKPNTYKLTEDKETLQIINSTIEESGEYICVAHSPGLITNRSASIEVYVEQSFDKRPSSTILLRGETATFECLSVGVPTPSTTWLFKSVQGVTKTMEMMRKEEKYLFSKNKLQVSNVLNKDEGVFYCISTSPGLTTNVSATLTVHIRPQISLSSYEASLLVGQSKEVICTAAGDPTPIVQWYKLKNNTNVIEKKISTSFDKRLYFMRVKKDDEGQYVCEAKSDAGMERAIFTLAVKATCALPVIKNSNPPKKYIYLENEHVKVSCSKGFSLNGSSMFTCTKNGAFNKPMSFCEDINECSLSNDTDPGSGSPTDDVDTIDNEPDVCDYYAQCVNTVGSYQCICDEGYQMIKNKCEFSPPGSKNKQPNPATVPPTTRPPPKNYSWLELLMQGYANQLISEEDYLSRLSKFSKEIHNFSHSFWRQNGLKNLLRALKFTMKENALYTSYTSNMKNIKNIKTFAELTSNILDTKLLEDWKHVDKKMNGTILSMKYLESYAVSHSKLLTVNEFNTADIIFSTKNLDMKLKPITGILKDKPVTLSASNKENGNEVVIPQENYKDFKDSISIFIHYKTLHKLLPPPTMQIIESPEILTDVISISFSSNVTSPLAKPIQIKFKVQQDSIPISTVCSFWDFPSGKWSTDGCRALNSTSSTEIICECSHLTNFAVIAPKETAAKVLYLTFSLFLAVGAGICLLFAFLTCMSHVCCSSYPRSSDRSIIMCNITVVIILGVLMFAGGVLLSSMNMVPKTMGVWFCYAILGALQLFGTAFFGWMFSEAIQMFYATHTVIGKGNGHLLLFYVIGWVLPILFVSVTGLLVYSNQFELKSSCILHVSLYITGILVGAPCLLYLLATIVTYVIVLVSLVKNKDLLNINITKHIKRAQILSGGLLLIHGSAIAAAIMFLRSNETLLYHYIFGGILAFEGIYLMLYHCFFDRRAGQENSRHPSKKRNSYSTKETVTYLNGSPDNTNEVTTETNDQKYFVRRSSKRLSGDSSRPSPPLLRTHNSSTNVHDQDNPYVGMYGGGSPNSPENRPLLQKEKSDDLPETIYEEDGPTDDTASLPTFGHNNIGRNNSVPSSRHNSLPRKKPLIWDEASIGGSHKPLKRSISRGSSIVSVETHTSSNGQAGIPVYFPAAPPHYEMSLRQNDNNQSQLNEIDSFLDDEGESRPTSFGIDSDRMSNISSELSNILFELQAFDTERHPSEAHDYMCREIDSKTLPNRREPTGLTTDLSRNESSTFKPQRGYAKTEISKPPAYTDNNRVRILRGKSRAEADPSDGLHRNNTDSMYASL